MLNVYSSKELSDNQFAKMYEILINNLFKTYPEFLDNKDKYDNKDNYNNLFNSIKTSELYNVICLEESDLLIGYLSYSVINDELWISEIQIRKEYQGKGVLRKLIRKFVSMPELKNYDYIKIHINKRNIHSQKVFEHIGFEKIGESTIYKIYTDNLIKWNQKNIY